MDDLNDPLVWSSFKDPSWDKDERWETCYCSVQTFSSQAQLFSQRSSRILQRANQGWLNRHLKGGKGSKCRTKTTWSSWANMYCLLSKNPLRANHLPSYLQLQDALCASGKQSVHEPCLSHLQTNMQKENSSQKDHWLEHYNHWSPSQSDERMYNAHHWDLLQHDRQRETLSFRTSKGIQERRSLKLVIKFIKHFPQICPRIQHLPMVGVRLKELVDGLKAQSCWGSQDLRAASLSLQSLQACLRSLFVPSSSIPSRLSGWYQSFQDRDTSCIKGLFRPLQEVHKEARTLFVLRTSRSFIVFSRPCLEWWLQAFTQRC